LLGKEHWVFPVSAGQAAALPVHVSGASQSPAGARHVVPPGRKASPGLNNGDGTFSAGTDVILPYLHGQIAVADINGDGVPDFAISSGLVSSPAIAIWLLAALVLVALFTTMGGAYFSERPGMAAAGGLYFSASGRTEAVCRLGVP
jgi:VCBS repeat protein